MTVFLSCETVSKKRVSAAVSSIHSIIGRYSSLQAACDGSFLVARFFQVEVYYFFEHAYHIFDSSGCRGEQDILAMQGRFARKAPKAGLLTGLFLCCRACSVWHAVYMTRGVWHVMPCYSLYVAAACVSLASALKYVLTLALKTDHQHNHPIEVFCVYLPSGAHPTCARGTHPF